MGEEWDTKRIIAAFAKKNCGDYDRSLHKVDWEWEGIQKFQLPEKCLYVRGGFILGWAVERDLLTADRPVGYGISFKKELAQFKAGEITGSRINRRFVDSSYVQSAVCEILGSIPGQ